MRYRSLLHLVGVQLRWTVTSSFFVLETFCARSSTPFISLVVAVPPRRLDPICAFAASYSAWILPTAAGLPGHLNCYIRNVSSSARLRCLCVVSGTAHRGGLLGASTVVPFTKSM